MKLIWHIKIYKKIYENKIIFDESMMSTIPDVS